MPHPNLIALERKLIREGVAPRHVRRSVDELDDHLQDLVTAFEEQGAAPETARQRAVRELGSLREIGEMIAAQPELWCWYRRWPRVASLIYPLATIAVLPLMPVVASREHAPAIARWSACLVLSAGFTGALLLVMQLSLQL